MAVRDLGAHGPVDLAAVVPAGGRRRRPVRSPEGVSGPLLPRRAWLAAAAGTVLAAGVPLAGCGTHPRPVLQQSGTTLHVALDVYALEKISTTHERAGFYRQVLDEFESAHRGIRVQQVGFLSTAANMAAIIAGRAADVFPDEAPAYAGYVEQGMLLRLDPYLQRDAVDPSIWSPSLVQTFRTATGTYGLSRDINVYVFAVRLSDFDALGLSYPSPDWTYVEFADLAAALARPSPSRRYGAVFSGGILGFREVIAGFGGSITNATHTLQTLTSAAGAAAGKWLFEGLVWPGAVALGGAPNLGDDSASVQEIQGHSLLTLFEQWGSAFKWALYPPPQYPHGRFGNLGAAFWAINAGTRHPDAAWTLLHWLSAEPVYQRFMMKTFLFPPALTALMTEWRQTVESVAPGLRGRGLRWIVEGARQGWGVPQPHFRYANVQAFLIDDQWWQRLLQRTVGVPTAFGQADAQVNALEAVAAREAPISLATLQAAQLRARRRLQQMFGT